MIKLKNIVIDEKVAKSEIIPEDSQEIGNIEVDLIENKILSFVLPQGYEWCENHLNHAKEYLVAISNSKSVIPKEKVIMWY